MMYDNSCANSTVVELKEIFEQHKTERIFVLGTMCAGKTTLLKQFPSAIDMDNIAFLNITEEEAEIINRKPWTKEVGDTVDKIVYRNVKVKAGQPVFGTVIVDCEVVVYLEISDGLLAKHCEKRGASLSDALNMKIEIEKDLNNHKNKGEKIFYHVPVTE